HGGAGCVEETVFGRRFQVELGPGLRRRSWWLSRREDEELQSTPHGRLPSGGGRPGFVKTAFNSRRDPLSAGSVNEPLRDHVGHRNGTRDTGLHRVLDLQADGHDGAHRYGELSREQLGQYV